MIGAASGHSGTVNLRVIFRLIAIAFWTILCVTVAVPARLLFPWFWWVVPSVYMTGLVWVLGLTVKMIGRPARDKSVLFISNHISWKDILIYSRLIKSISFVSKSEVGKSAFGRFMANLQKTIYIRRSRKAESKQQSAVLEQRLNQGDRLMLFPEGTTTRGVRVKPFKTALFSVVERVTKTQQKPQIVQPVTICYTHINHLPILYGQRSSVGFVGRVPGMQHFFAALSRKRTDVRVEFHDPIYCDDQLDRKILAQQCFDVISTGLSSAHRQR